MCYKEEIYCPISADRNRRSISKSRLNAIPVKFGRGKDESWVSLVKMEALQDMKPLSLADLTETYSHLMNTVLNHS